MSIILKGLHIASKQLAYLAIIVSIILVMAAGAAYWLSVAIEQRQDEIVVWLGDKIGYPVTIDSAQMSWSGISPKLELKQFKIYNKESTDTLLSLDMLQMGLNVWQSIQRTEPVVSNMSMVGLSLSLIRDETGHVSLKGLDFSASGTEKDSDLLSKLNLLHQFHLHSIAINYTDLLSSELSGNYEIDHAVIDHDQLNWSVTANVVLPEQLGSSLQFKLKTELLESDLANSQWQGSIEAEGIAVKLLSPYLVKSDVSVKQGLTDVVLSGQGQGSNVSSLTASLSLTQVELNSLQPLDNPTVMIDRFSAEFDWQQDSATSWSLSANDIELSVDGELWPNSHFAINQQGDTVIAESNYLNLSSLSSIASLSQYSPEFIRQQKAAGDVNDLALNYSLDEGLESLSFELIEGATLPWQDYPGVTGLSLAFNLNDGLTTVNFDSHKVNLYAKKWLEDSVYFDSITGSVSLQQDDKIWSFQSQDLRVWNDDLTLQLDGRVEKIEAGQTYTNIKLTLEDVVASTWKKYIPQQGLDKDFRAWAKNAFVQGVIKQGEIELVGNLADFPYETTEDDSRFTIKLNTEGVQLHYAPDWPDLSSMNAMITGLGNTLTIKSSSGKISGFDVDNITTVITLLTESKPILHLEGLLHGSTEKALRFVDSSPLQQRFGSAVKLLKATGKSDIKLNLMVPLAKTDATTVSGWVNFKDSQLYYSELADVKLKQINGLLNFNGEGVKAKGIKANFLDNVVTINAQPKEGHTNILIDGQISTQQLSSVFPNVIPPFIKGQSAYQLDINVVEESHGQFYIDYGLTSDLAGIAIDLPEPFLKEAQQLKPLTISAKKEKNSTRYVAKYGELFNTVAIEEKNKWRAGIRFGKGKLRLPNHGVSIAGHLQELSVDDWLDWSEKYASTEGDSLLQGLDELSVSIDSLALFDQQFTGVNCSASKDGQGWRIALHSDQTKGAIYWPFENQHNVSMDIDLDRLNIVLAEQSSSKLSASMALWPKMNIAIGELNIDDKTLGELALSASRSDQQWLVNSASLTSDIFTATVSQASWFKSNSEETSQLQLTIISENLTDVLTSFGYQQAIESDQLMVNTELNWLGSPLDLSLATVAGTLDFSVGKGKLKDVEPGAAGRILGLMSIVALPRRLALDFSDLFSSGFNFDSISASFALNGGLAKTDDFILKGPSAEIEIVGMADMVEQSYDQQVTITPNVSSTLPLAGAVAGGPVGLGVGTAILLVDKLSGSLFGKNIINLISYRYTLTGPWDEPEFKVYSSASEQE